jgi:hypothetical protein
VIKALFLFAIVNIIYALTQPLPALGNISIYNRLVPGRTRLPYGEDPTTAYNLTLNNLDSMFASHEINAAPKPEDEFRVILIGDSSTWGYLLSPEQTLSSQINAAHMRTQDGRRIVAYNFGYPVMSLLKDLVILDRASSYQPDLIIWLVTLESFPRDKQLFPPLLQNNAEAAQEIIAKYQLDLAASPVDLPARSFVEKSILGSRRELADWLRLQLYGVLWAATGIDQDIPDQFPQRIEDLPAEEGFHDLLPPALDSNDLAFDVLQAGVNNLADVPVLIVNEPMFISRGENSDIRYNFYYPRWAYDGYRALLAEISAGRSWNYLDLWNLVPSHEFTNTAIHMTPEGTSVLADRLVQAIRGIASQQP